MFSRTKLRNSWRFIKKINTFSLVGVVVLMIVMLVSSNYANSQNLERAELAKNIRSNEDEIRLLNTQVSELQTTERLEQESQKLDLVKIQTEDIYYLSDNQDRVALK